MFRILSGQIKSAVLFIAVVASLGTASVAHADITGACFNFISAQDYSRAVTEAKSLLKRKGLASEGERSALLCLGSAHRATGRFREALPALLRAESLSRSTEELAITYFMLGSIYLGMGDLDRAELYTQRAIKAYKELGETNLESMGINNLAVIVRNRGDLDRALMLFRESLALEPDGVLKSTTLNNIATIHLERKEFDEAAKLLREAVEISRRQGDGHKTALFQINLGGTLRKQGDLAGAEQELTAGLKVTQLIGARDDEAAAYDQLGMLEMDRKDTLAASGWFNRAVQTYRAIGQTAKADSLAAAAAQFINGTSK
jgi:tetratricopeptide (TPR) repeat protein